MRKGLGGGGGKRKRDGARAVKSLKGRVGHLIHKMDRGRANGGPLRAGIEGVKVSGNNDFFILTESWQCQK